MKPSKRMNNNFLMIGCLATMISMAIGCSKDNPLNPAGNCFGGNWAEKYTAELQAWSNAANAYAEDPSASNCTNYKNAGKTYLDAIDDLYDCIP
ncbi:MAG: hypothetical protein WBM83_12695, partial [Flavobacteriaceae bacterium]